ncbi:MAG TPA: MOSC domain-containing protein [Deltaproteobacteria bacterium]|nr:MOSC domain-containing protein [Deltaproteobacteria bacterium]
MITRLNQTGTVLSVNVSHEKGQKKHTIGACMLVEGIGLQDDAHAGMEVRQVSLLGKESIEKIRAKGLNVQYGDFAENLTTEGIIFHELPIGTRFSVGERVILELSQIGKVCLNRCAIYYQVGDCVMPREGVFAIVVVGGEIKVGDEIIILS